MDLDLHEDGRVTILTLKGDLGIGDSETLFKRTVSRLLEGKGSPLIDCTGLRRH